MHTCHLHNGPCDACPTYSEYGTRAEAGRYGRMALVAMNFYIQTGAPLELTAAYWYARHAAAYARSAIVDGQE